MFSWQVLEDYAWVKLRYGKKNHVYYNFATHRTTNAIASSGKGGDTSTFLKILNILKYILRGGHKSIVHKRLSTEWRLTTEKLGRFRLKQTWNIVDFIILDIYDWLNMFNKFVTVNVIAIAACSYKSSSNVPILQFFMTYL